MDENEKVVNQEEVKETKNEKEEKETKEMAETEEKAKVKETKNEKVGFFKKTGRWIKKHKRELLSGVAGLGAGIGGTYGLMKLGEHMEQKKAQNTVVEPEYVGYDPDETLSPNVD